MNIKARPLEYDEFSPFGTVLEPGLGAVKAIRDGTVRLTRPEADLRHDEAATTPAVEFYECAPTRAPFDATRIEQHPHSMQLFAPMQPARWLVIVWPAGSRSEPCAFVARGAQAIAYHPGIWHHGIIALDQPARFISWMWRTNGPDDTVFADLPDPVRIGWPGLDGA